MPIKYLKTKRGPDGFSHEEQQPPRSAHAKKPEKARPSMPYKIFFAGLLLVVFLSFLFLFYVTKNLPDPNRLIEREVAQSTRIYDRTGQTVLYEIFGNEKRTLINIDDLPPYVKQATIAIEDKDFYKHRGVSLWAILRTAVTNIVFRQKAGASTLTQQFVKNAVLSPEKTYTRKLKEAILAYRLEKKFSKDEILQMYLNEIPYGSTAYGIEAASQRYFGVNAKNLSLAQAALLAALTQAPSRDSPYGPNKDSLIARQQYILDQMSEQGYISSRQAEEAKREPLEFKEQDSNIVAPHFVMYVKEVLAEKYGEKLVEQGGLKIITTLDLYKQKIAEEVISEWAEKNLNKYAAWNSSLVAIDPKTGQVLSMVGSKDYFAKAGPEGCISGSSCKFEPNDNVSLRPRQPGSSIKPIVYATAFVRGFTPQTNLYDVVTSFSNDPDNPYAPSNYDGNENGPVSMKKALAGSLNIPAVKTLYLAGLNNVLDVAKELGYTTLSDPDRLGLSMVLGGGEIKLIEHANAYSAFARDGLISPISSLLKIEDANGNILEEFQESSRKAIDSNVAREINDILSDNGARAYIFGSSNWLTLGDRPVAAKTGTTNDNRDAWTIGYTPSLVAGVWVGNNDNSQMKAGSDGSVVAAPIWHDYMKKVLGDTPVENFKKPTVEKTGKCVLDGCSVGEETVKIDRASGLLATELTPPDYVIEKTYAQHHSILYYVDKNNPRGDYPQKPQDDPQFHLWENAVKAWAEKRGNATSTPPKEYDNVHTKENQPEFVVENLEQGQTITDTLFNVSINATAYRGVAKAEYYLNGGLIGVNEFPPFGLDKDISHMSNGYHDLRIRVCDDVDNCTEKTISFNLSKAEQEQRSPVEWISPQNGLVVQSFDFPIEFKARIEDYGQVQKAEFYYQSIGSQDPVLLTKIDPVASPDVSFSWYRPLTSGVYRIYGMVFYADETIKKGPALLITVSSPN